MRFTLIDKITAIEPGSQIEAVKNLTLAEEYLADHFPLFPVMPGVFMVEAMTQTSAWLIRASEDFAHSVVILSEARNVKYADFVSPGQQLKLTSKILKQSDSETQLETRGTVDDKISVSARLVLKRYNLADTDARKAHLDANLRTSLRTLFQLLYPS